MVWIVGVSVYLAFVYITLAALLHAYAMEGRKGSAVVVRSTILSLFWPVYWPAAHGVAPGIRELLLHFMGMMRGVFFPITEFLFDASRLLFTQTLHTLDVMLSMLNSILVQCATAIRNLADCMFAAMAIYFPVGLLIVPPMYVDSHWESCAGLVNCNVVVAKALLWSPFWPVYLCLYH
jgi:hypothetical protein